MVVDVGGSEREERRAARAEQQLRQHEEQNRHHVAARALDAVVGLAVLDAVVRAQGHALGQVWRLDIWKSASKKILGISIQSGKGSVL